MTTKKLRLVLGQINPIVADIDYNADKIVNIIQVHPDTDIIIFPEMSLVGYPLMDHIHDPLIQKRNQEALKRIKSINTKATVIVGTFTQPSSLSGSFQPFYNSAVVIEGDKIKNIENKRLYQIMMYLMNIDILHLIININQLILKV